MDKFNIAFSGEVLPDHQIEQVKLRFAKAFHLEQLGRIDAFFSGQKIILRRNLEKDEAALVFVKLRKLGLDVGIERAEPVPEQVEAKVAPPETPAPAPKKPRRKRQPGAPNIFDLHLSERAGHSGPEEISDSLIRAPMIAAALVMLAFVLVGVRFLSQTQAPEVVGLGYLAIDPRQQAVVQAGEEFFFHDQLGQLLKQRPVSDLAMQPHTPFAFFNNGDLLLQRIIAGETEKGLNLPWLESETPSGLSLARCAADGKQCNDLTTTTGQIAFATDVRNDIIYLADADRDSLTKFSGSGKILASKQMELTEPLHLAMQEGILYLTQANSDAVLILKPDEQEFARELDRVSLVVEHASQTGHIYAGDLTWLNDRWWVIMQSRDGSAAGLYQFGPRWKYLAALPLPADSQPTRLTAWDTRVLVRDGANDTIYRFDAAGRPERDFSSEAIEQALKPPIEGIGLSRGLQGLVLMILFVTAAGLLAFGMLQTLRGKIYVPPAEQGEQGFDIDNDEIDWLDPNPEASSRMRQLGFGMSGFAVVVLLGGFIASLSVWFMLAIITLFSGLGGLYFAWLRATHCYLGTLEGRLILVDHNNTYRVGSDSTIQHFSNYIMIDDVIIYLGNRLIRRFSSTALEQIFTPLVNRGIKVDRTTLRVKLIQARHPMWLGSGGLALALIAAVLLSLAG